MSRISKVEDVDKNIKATIEDPNSLVYLVNPIVSHNFNKSNVGSNKTDSFDAFSLADFAASGKTNKLQPFKARQHFSIQSLAR